MSKSIVGVCEVCGQLAELKIVAGFHGITYRVCKNPSLCQMFQISKSKLKLRPGVCGYCRHKHSQDENCSGLSF